jgi:hypothetical protein
MLYNDAYRPVFGRDKHPGFIGTPPLLSPSSMMVVMVVMVLWYKFTSR